MQVGETRGIAQVDYVRVVIEHLGKTTLIFPVDFDSESSNPILDTTTVAPPSDEASDLPWFSFYFHA